MADGDLVLAVDQGTSATKAVLLDDEGAAVAEGRARLGQQLPAPGHVEQSAVEIWRSVQEAVAQCLAGHDASRVRSVGLSTQRESMLLWERRSGEPVGPVLGWQDRRTRDLVARLHADGAGELVRERTGLPLDPMFSAAKAAWLLDRYDPDRRRSGRGELVLGTVDSWLLSRFGGDHLIETGNASRTQLLDLRERRWDEQLLALFRVPREALPEPVGSTGPFPGTRGLAPLPDGTPVGAVLGDSHAALLVHTARDPRAVKATYGTGSSVMALADAQTRPDDGLCLTLAWDLPDGPAHALEGNIRSSAATLAWLATLLGTTPDEVVDRAARSTSDGVHLVPAFTGLGCPWWDPDATATLSGMTFATGADALARAAVESVAFQVEDVVALVEGQRGAVTRLVADGGPAANPALMQVQADISGRRVESHAHTGLSALGAGHLAGATAGSWALGDVPAHEPVVFEPRTDAAGRDAARHAWHRAVARTR